LEPPGDGEFEFSGFHPRLAIRAKLACARVDALLLLRPCETEIPFLVNLPRFAGLMFMPELRAMQSSCRGNMRWQALLLSCDPPEVYPIYQLPTGSLLMPFTAALVGVPKQRRNPCTLALLFRFGRDNSRGRIRRQKSHKIIGVHGNNYILTIIYC
jgi:hypothetical protein